MRRVSLKHPLGVVSEPVNLVCPKELLEVAVEKLKDLALQLLNKQRLNHGEVQAFGTPRRLMFLRLVRDAGVKPFLCVVDDPGTYFAIVEAVGSVDMLLGSSWETRTVEKNLWADGHEVMCG
ncbi:hypothetical protein Ddye_031841 [Dipteronia dyeriana]|uniref:Uncharacterized protein n=1 Tax=Dipteronia dyeriana TaxID=168575 RepID=A0AAD9WMN3_9ROSI|nr:hypothetical protein Ddye_031841 [Dipteronia dyeriana]